MTVDALRRCFLMCAAVAIACGSPNGSGSKTGHPLADRFEPAFCSFATRCCQSNGGNCSKAAVDALAFLGPDVANELDAGGVTIDQTALDACLAEVGLASCTDLTFLFSHSKCRAAVQGQRGDGERCIEYIGCRSGFDCVLGTCAPTGTQGTACDGGFISDVASGFVRSRGCGRGLFCMDGQCGTAPGVNERCRGTQTAYCDPSMAWCDCLVNAGGCSTDAGTCRAFVPLAQSCSRSVQCGPLRSCSAGKCVTAGQDFMCSP